MPNATLVMPDLTNVLITLGDSCELASCSATRVSVNTTPRKVSVAAAMLSRKPLLQLASAGKPPQEPTNPGPAAVSTASPVPRASSTAGITQNRSRTHSPAQRSRYPPDDTAASASTGGGPPYWSAVRMQPPRARAAPGGAVHSHCAWHQNYLR